MSISAEHTHPLLTRVHELREGAAEVAGLPLHVVPAGVKGEALVEVVALEAQLADLRLRLLAAAGDVAENSAARDAGAWLAHATQRDPRQAHGEWRLAKILDARYPEVSSGMRTGEVSEAQARVIAAALDELPAEVPALVARSAEVELVKLAHTYNPRELRIAGRRILELVAPDIADEHEARALEREEQRAREKCSIRLRSRGDGTTALTGVLPDSAAARLNAYLEALISPRQHLDPAPRHRLMGQAFCTLLEHLDPATLPDHGGDATTIMVTIPLDALTSALGTATLEDGTPISASEARRLACTAQIIPAVLGGKDEILNLGRTDRIYRSPQRRAMRLRDKHCRAEGCLIPARWCEAHHLKPWSEGGKTDLDDGVLLCSHHHHRAHDARYEMTRLTSGDLRFHRRT